MKSAIVIQIKQRKAVVLRADGAFVRVPANSAWKVGDVVVLPAAAKGRATLLLAAAACFAFLALGGALASWLYVSPAAIISVDVNPSIELSVNRWNRVVAASGLNDEGTDILASADVKNVEFRQALQSILTAERAKGYLEAQANVVLTVFAPNAGRQSALLAALRDIVSAEAAGYADSVTTEYYAVDAATVNGAHGHGVTAGKYLYLQQLQALAPEADLAVYSHHSIDQLKGQIEACRQEHGAQANPGPHGGAHGNGKRCD